MNVLVAPYGGALEQTESSSDNLSLIVVAGSTKCVSDYLRRGEERGEGGNEKRPTMKICFCGF